MYVYHTGSSAATQSESVSGPSSHRERNRISMNRPAPALQCLKNYFEVLHGFVAAPVRIQ